MGYPTKTILYADGHLKRSTWVTRPYIKNDSYAALDQIIDLCILEYASLIIVGDAFDSKRITGEEFAQLYIALRRMRAADLPVFAIHGNHDGGENPWMSVLTDFLTFVDLEFFEPCEGVHMYGIGYRPKRVIEEIVSNLPPKATTLVMHQCVKQALPFGWNLDLDWMPSQVRRVYFGDIHKASDHRTESGLMAHSPGSPHITEITHDVERSVVMIEKDKPCTRIPLKSRGVVHIKVGVDTEADPIEDVVTRCIDGLAAELGKYYSHDGMEPIVHIRYPAHRVDEVTAHFDAWQPECAVHKWLDPFIPNDDQEDPSDSMPDLDKDIDYYAILRDTVQDDLTSELIWELLNTQDRLSVLSDWRAKAGIN